MRHPLASLLLLLPLAARASGVTGGEVLNQRPSARAVAMGEAYAALGDDLGGLAYNPAALARLPGPSATFLHYAQVAGVALEDLAYAQPSGIGVLAASLRYRGQPDIANPLASDSPVSAWDLVLSAAWAGALEGRGWPLPDWLSRADAGLALKFVQSHLARYDAMTVAADLGVQLPLREGLRLGLSLLNLGPGLRFVDVTDPLPAAALVGLSRSFEPFWGMQINAGADLEAPFQDAMRLHFGAEDWLGENLALRLGYLLDSEQSLGGFTAGFGVRLLQEGLNFHLDYALRPLYYSGFASFEAQHQFQIGLTF